MIQKIKRGTIVVGYPGVGKSSIKHKDFIDLESSDIIYVDNLAWKYGKENAKGRFDRVRKDNFLHIYCNEIVKNYSPDKIMAVWNNKKVIDFLAQEKMPFCVVAPMNNPKNISEFVNRYKKRGNDEYWIFGVDRKSGVKGSLERFNADEFRKKYDCEVFELDNKTFLSDILELEDIEIIL